MVVARAGPVSPGQEQWSEEEVVEEEEEAAEPVYRPNPGEHVSATHLQ